MWKLRVTRIKLMLLLLECLWHAAVVTINTLRLVVFLPVSVSFWFWVWEERKSLSQHETQESGRRRQSVFAFLFALLLIASFCSVGSSSGESSCCCQELQSTLINTKLCFWLPLFKWFTSYLFTFLKYQKEYCWVSAARNVSETRMLSIIRLVQSTFSPVRRT